MNTKTELKYFTILQWQQEQNYLSNMHAKGWKFIKVSGLGVYHFEQCEPAKVTY